MYNRYGYGVGIRLTKGVSDDNTSDSTSVVPCSFFDVRGSLAKCAWLGQEAAADSVDRDDRSGPYRDFLGGAIKSQRLELATKPLGSFSFLLSVWYNSNMKKINPVRVLLNVKGVTIDNII